MHSQVLAILWVQWRSLWHFRTGEGLAGRILGTAMALLWYGMWAALAVLAASFLSEPGQKDNLAIALPWGFAAVFLYWQLSPVATASLGASLNLNKLLIYPIPTGQLFFFEVLLRITTGFEMLLILTGVTVGLLANPAVWPPAVVLAVPVFTAFNLFLAAGLKNLLGRFAGHRRVREAVVFLIVLVAAVPQLVAVAGVPPVVRRFFSGSPLAAWPWTTAGRLALGDSSLVNWMVLGAWTVAAYAFGRWQFVRSLESGAAAAAGPLPRTARWSDRLYSVPGWFLPDPVGALVEKELRSLFRAPRFRLVFLMGFTFGFLIWVPLLRTARAAAAGPPESFPVFVSVYAVLLLSEVVFWNVFGFDRSAAQFYYAAPVPLSRVLAAKNIAAWILIMAEVTLVAAVCVLLRIRVPAGKFLETYAVLVVLSIYMLATGNLSSLYRPRAVDPDNSWNRGSGGKVQALMMLLFPLLGSPVLLAYGARYAFESDTAFYAVLALVGGIGAVYYWVAMDSAVSVAEQRKEKLLSALSQGGGPLG